METFQLQQLFFEQIKSRIASNKSFVDEVADLLNISNDSAYRRIRGEKQISFEEIKTLAAHFKISVDQLLHLQTDSFIFSGRITNNTDFKFEEWQKSVLVNLQTIASFSPNHYYYLAKEIPFLYYYMLPEIAAFKSYFFLKSILFYDDWKTAKFSVKDDSFNQYHELWRKISDTYASIPGTEIWSIENITSTIHQIEYYHITGSLKSVDDAIYLLDKLEELINHVEKQAEYGVKLTYNQKPSKNLAAYKMYVNELIMGDNMQFMELGDKQVTYINHSVLNFILTHDVAFNNYTKKTFDIITQKSTPISEVNERERLLFFNRLRAKVHLSRKQITG
ncbi:MAG TPA: helix-turn-helix domain-containing protein [Chitinophagaceae bacterium]|nr:helix-turn-helix domain-containing protein [Chitinophagaceae bacterium]